MALLSLLFSSVMLPLAPSENIPACNSLVFCQGPLLAAVQNASIFSDSKVFVDRPLTHSPDTVLEAFRNLSDPRNATLLRQFVQQWTQDAGSDLEIWEPSDWVERPQFVDSIKDEKLRQWALDLNSVWKQLGRRVAPSVSDNRDRHSLIYLPNPFIIPGGRFRETYYWDTYWILEGLLLCEMNDTARGMIENMAYLVDQYGLVPNGGRQYYSRRSQPPLLAQMVERYFNWSGNTTFLRSVLPALVTEYQFWVTNRSVGLSGTYMQQYRASTNTPRPESYREDIATAEKIPEGERARLYQNLASGAESGWDFSTRWLAHSGSEAGQLASIMTDSVVPVDLNAILCANEASLSRLFRAIGKEAESWYYGNQTFDRRAKFDGIFWNDSLGLWRDWRMSNVDDSLSRNFYASSFAPLVWRCGQGGIEQDEKFLSTLNSLGILDYPGGVPTSLWKNSTQQWDFPNAWAPLQWMLVLAWHDSPSAALRAAAEKVAKTWLTTTYLAWEEHNRTMFEKYNCTAEGEPGGGGEYDIQTGFGWTNGVVLQLLSLYPDTDISSDHSEQNLGWVSVIVLTLVTVAVSIPCIVWCRWLYVRGRDRYWGRVRNEHLIAAQGGLSHARSHSRPHSPTTYINSYANTGSDDMIYDETLLEFDV